MIISTFLLPLPVHIQLNCETLGPWVSVDLMLSSGLAWSTVSLRGQQKEGRECRKEGRREREGVRLRRPITKTIVSFSHTVLLHWEERFAIFLAKYRNKLGIFHYPVVGQENTKKWNLRFLTCKLLCFRKIIFLNKWMNGDQIKTHLCRGICIWTSFIGILKALNY